MPRKRTVPKETVQTTALELIGSGTKPTNRNVKKALGRGGTGSIAADLREMDAIGLWERMKPTSAKREPQAPTDRPKSAAYQPHQVNASNKVNRSLLTEIADLKRTVAQLADELIKLQKENNDRRAPASDTNKRNDKLDKIPFEGMSISDAAIYILEEHGQPMSAMKIAYTLESQGFKFVKEPSRAVTNALLYRSKERNDVIKVGYRTWGLPSRDNPSNVRQDINYSNKTDKEYQIERSKLAHQLARERGMSVGRPAFEKTHTFKVVLEYRRLRELGAGIYEALDACGITRSSYSKYRWVIENAATEAEYYEAARRIRQDAHSS